jgi:tetrahydromethanopterin S-methyltransferase subunit G
VAVPVTIQSPAERSVAPTELDDTDKRVRLQVNTVQGEVGRRLGRGV